MHPRMSMNAIDFRFHPDSLTRHFDNHKNEFAGAYNTAQQYQKGAIAVIKAGVYFDSIHEENPTRIYYKKFKDDTYHFVATRKSTILSYHTREWHQIDKLKSSDKQKPAHTSLYNKKISSGKNESTIPSQPQKLFAYSAMKSSNEVETENMRNSITRSSDVQAVGPKAKINI